MPTFEKAVFQPKRDFHICAKPNKTPITFAAVIYFSRVDLREEFPKKA